MEPKLEFITEYMKNNQKSKFTDATLALAAASLVGCASPHESSRESAAASGTTDLVHCYGVNACKGHNGCKTAENACAGQAQCKGQGFVAMPSKACSDVGGQRKDDWVGSISKADLLHCYGVNVCKGHNDCKTAENACAGQAQCKGQGFVVTIAKSCSDLNGKTGA